MLDSEGFVASGFVHDLKLHQYEVNDSSQFLIMGKVVTNILFTVLNVR